MKLVADPPKNNCMFGTTHWYGTINGRPAVSVSWYNGAAMWIFAGKWKRKVFRDVPSMYEYYGIKS